MGIIIEQIKKLREETSIVKRSALTTGQAD